MLQRILHSFILGLLIFSTVISVPAYADPISPEAEQLVSQAESFIEDLQEKPSKPEEKPEIVLEKEKEAPPAEPGPSFLVKEVRLEGNTLFSDKELKPFVETVQNRQINFENLKTFAQLITNHYRSKGFSTSRAYIPPQKIADGLVTVKIIEGKIGNVRAEGNRFFSNQTYVNSIVLRPDRILNYSDLESSLYFLNRKPDRKAKAYLMEGAEPMTSDIILKTEDSNPFHVYYEFHNRGSRLTHHSRHALHVDHNNFMGLGDTLKTSVSGAEEGAFRAGALQYNHFIESKKLDFGLDISYVDSMLVRHLKSAEVKGESLNITPSATYSLIRKPTVQLDGVLSFEFKDSKSLIDDFKTSFDRMRELSLGPRLTTQDASGRSIFSADIHQGIPSLLGGLRQSDRNASRLHSGGNSLYYTVNAARVQRLPGSTFLVVRGGGQWTRDSLTAVDQYRLGGAYTVRGYPESDGVGDYGYLFSSEWNFPVPYLPQGWAIPYAKKTWAEAVRLALFLDGGKTFLRERQTSAEVKDKFLLGAGFGLRVDLDKNLSLNWDFGFPIGNTPSKRNSRLATHLSVKAGF